MSTGFSFSIDPAVAALGIQVRGFLAHGLDNASPSPGFESLRHAELIALKASSSAQEIQASAILAGYRRLHEKIGKTGRRWVSAPENLKRALLDAPAFPSINKVVDIYNLVSLQTSLAFGAHDLSKITGNVSLRLATGDEAYWPIGATEPGRVSRGEYAYCDDARDVICRLEIRQVEKTKVLPRTKDIFFIIQGHQDTPDTLLSQAQERLVRLLSEYAGGTYGAL
jgi:DNA/RNA-binding domain of Phe-tRNA-synthetase-like protein